MKEISNDRSVTVKPNIIDTRDAESRYLTKSAPRFMATQSP